MINVDLVQIYANHMGQMKRRMVIVDGILQTAPGLAEGRTTNADGPALESFALQFRKVLELIAFGGLIAHRATYEAAHEDFVNHNYPTKISQRLDKLHPRWFPEHVNVFAGPSVSSGVGYVQPAASAFNRGRWQSLYDAMGRLLHIGNPFAGLVQVDIDRPLPEVHRMVKRHMQTHRVFVPQGHDLLCDLRGWPDERCTVTEGTPLEAI